MSIQATELELITEEELKLRDGVQSNEIWIAYKGLVYDVTSSPLFAGGKHYRHPSGKDLTAPMEKAPHTDIVIQTFKVVGKYVDKCICKK